MRQARSCRADRLVLRLAVRLVLRLALRFVPWLALATGRSCASPLRARHRRRHGALTCIRRSILMPVPSPVAGGSRDAPPSMASPPLCRPSLFRRSPRGSS